MRPVAVEISGVGHGYGTLAVLSEISVEVAPGELVALLGPSGSGKSTLLRLVAGLEAPLHGAVRVDGVGVSGPDPSRALVFQDPTLFPWRSVWANVAVGPQARGRLKQERGRIDEALALVGLQGFEQALPHQLSGGMAQRVALARALVNRPPLLLLDEPLGKLDALTRLSLQRELLRLWEGGSFTALLVTHDVDEALLLADRVIVLSDRPARILADLRVDLERPRRHADPRRERLRDKVLDLLGLAEARDGAAA
ncbi:ABC transporter ATP-binding protein [Conexibacter sp. CPCC 206217]|nr:ABC transporter ATP-binding protein [Conexibacter sp. CPCC 206217]MDO8208822.1 ABC transporter ATP-binding protein [Conexibacter sp. CPCC 206217]